jgi:hypothetical protein
MCSRCTREKVLMRVLERRATQFFWSPLPLPQLGESLSSLLSLSWLSRPPRPSPVAAPTFLQLFICSSNAAVSPHTITWSRSVA